MRLFQKKEGAPAKGLPRRILPLALAAAVLAAGGFGAVRLLGGGGGGEQIVTDLVTRDTIQSTVKGSGAASARESVSLNPPVSATVLALHVKEGDRVEKGTVLYELDPAEAQKATEEAKKSLTEAEKGVTAAAERLQAAQKQLSETEEEYQKLLASKADLTVTAPFDGKLVEAASLLPDAEITAGQKLATLVSSNRLKLSLYYSYAYLDQLRVGQEAAVSIPGGDGLRTGENQRDQQGGICHPRGLQVL